MFEIIGSIIGGVAAIVASWMVIRKGSKSKETALLKAAGADSGIDTLLAPREGRFDLNDFVDEAMEVLITGITLGVFTLLHSKLIRTLINSKCRMRFVILSPESPVLDSIDYNLSEHAGEKETRRDLQSTLLRLAKIYRSLPDSEKRLLSVRLYRGVPFFSGTKINTRISAENPIWIEYYSYDQPISKRRGVYLTSKSSPVSYKFYNDSLEALWGASEDFDLGLSPQK